MPKLTKRIVDAAEAQAAEYFVWVRTAVRKSTTVAAG